MPRTIIDIEIHRIFLTLIKIRRLDDKGIQIVLFSFYGDSADLAKSLYTLLSVGLPPSENHDMLLFNLDIQQIAASSGSACTSGSQQPSHVIEALQAAPQRGTIRFSLSKYNTVAEIDYAVEKLAELCPILA